MNNNIILRGINKFDISTEDYLLLIKKLKVIKLQFLS